jgi:hypothetical protein
VANSGSRRIDLVDRRLFIDGLLHGLIQPRQDVDEGFAIVPLEHGVRGVFVAGGGRVDEPCDPADGDLAVAVDECLQIRPGYGSPTCCSRHESCIRIRFLSGFPNMLREFPGAADLANPPGYFERPVQQRPG